MIKNLIIPLFCSVLLFTGCKNSPPVDSRPIVTVTIEPMRYFAEQLAGDNFKINVLVPPGVSHHNYDPTPRQLKELEKSKVIFVNGHLGFENIWIPKMRSNYRNLAIVDLSSGMNLITSEDGEGGHNHENETETESDEHSHEGVDPHYWLSVSEAGKMAANMAAGLIKADPGCGQLIEQNLARLQTRIDSLGAMMAVQFQPLVHRSFLIFHPALTYLARDYNLVQHPMELGGKEPTASHFKELVNLADSGKINTIFVQKEYDQENARTLANETHARIVIIDPMSPDWFEEMKRLASAIAGMDHN